MRRGGRAVQVMHRAKHPEFPQTPGLQATWHLGREPATASIPP